MFTLDFIFIFVETVKKIWLIEGRKKKSVGKTRKNTVASVEIFAGRKSKTLLRFTIS